MTVRSVLVEGDPVLRQRSVEVPASAFGSRELDTLIDDLVETMHARSGAGIAAPQIGVLQRVCVVEVVEGHARYRGHPTIPLTILINPTIEELTGESFENYEGCLSVPGWRGSVRRAAGVRLRASDRAGDPFEQVVWGVRAGVFQHECDHLDGVLFVDRVEGPEALWPLEVFEERFRPGYADHVAAVEARFGRRA